MLVGKSWTADEIATLRRLAPGMTAAAISLELPGRTMRAVRRRANIMRISLQKSQRAEHVWLPDKVMQARLMWDAGDNIEVIAKKLKCSLRTVANLRDGHEWPKRAARVNLDLVGIKARLGVLWPTGASCAVIGRELGITVNAVVGLRRRMDLPKRPSPINRTGVPRKPPSPRPPPCSAVTLPPLVSLAHVACTSVAAVVRQPAPPKPRLVEAFGPPVAPRVFSQCCWPVGEPGTRAFRYCDADVFDRGVYCAECRKRAFARSARQQHLEAA